MHIFFSSVAGESIKKKKKIGAFEPEMQAKEYGQVTMTRVS